MRGVTPLGVTVLGLALTACGPGDTEPTAQTGGPALTAAPATSAPAPPSDAQAEPLFDVPEDAAEGAPLEQLIPRAGLPATVDVVGLDEGQVVAAQDGTGRAVLRFPAFSASPSPARAIVRVTPESGSAIDPLAPGTRDFLFGVEFALDEESQGTEVDGGDNLIQRGLASDDSQFKIDVDDRRPLCRIQGPLGMAEVKVTNQVLPGQWHRATCSRTGDEIQLTVEALDDGDATVLETVTAQTATGDLQWERAATPMSVGGKLAANGEVIRSATDQFNGTVTNPMLQITD